MGEFITIAWSSFRTFGTMEVRSILTRDPSPAFVLFVRVHVLNAWCVGHTFLVYWTWSFRTSHPPRIIIYYSCYWFTLSIRWRFICSISGRPVAVHQIASTQFFLQKKHRSTDYYYGLSQRLSDLPVALITFQNGGRFMSHFYAARARRRLFHRFYFIIFSRKKQNANKTARSVYMAGKPVFTVHL